MKDIFIKILGQIDREGIEDLICFLEGSDFFTAPASTKFHFAVEGGLLRHSMNVYNLLKEREKDYRKDSVIICGLLHDICKTGMYYKDYKWTKDHQNKWQKEWCWKKKYDNCPWGHGEKSVILLKKYISLTDDEITAIRWHMNNYTEGAGNGTELNMCLKEAMKVPLVVSLFLADFEAANILEVENDKDS